MRALVYYEPNHLQYTLDHPKPEISKDNEVLIQVSYCGICGSDLKEVSSSTFFNKDGTPNRLTGLPAPLAMGHEIAGVVTQVGSKVSTIKVGDHVVVEPSLFCNDIKRFPESPLEEKSKCTPCSKDLTNICDYSSISGLGGQNGGLAEWFITTEEHSVKIPESIPLEIAALVQPLAVSWHAVRISDFKPGSSVLIFGAGAVGLTAILAAQGHRASKIVVSEPSEIRRNNAIKLGAIGFNPFDYEEDKLAEELIKMSPSGHGFDYSYDCSGFQSTFTTAIRATTTNGTIVNVAIWGKDPVKFWPMDITRTEKKLMGSMCYTRQDFEEVLESIARGDIDVENAKNMITTVVDLEHGIEYGFNHLSKNKASEVKILITPNNFNEIEHAKSFAKTHLDLKSEKTN